MTVGSTQKPVLLDDAAAGREPAALVLGEREVALDPVALATR